MKLGWVIHYVADVRRSVEFYERAFGLKRRSDEIGEFAEMETGATALAFAAHALIQRMGMEDPSGATPHGSEIALVCPEAAIEAAWQRAVDAGATPLQPLTKRPWGQTVGYVRDLDGFTVEICTPVGGG